MGSEVFVNTREHVGAVTGDYIGAHDAAKAFLAQWDGVAWLDSLDAWMGR